MIRVLLIAGTDSSGGAGLFRDQSVARALGIDSVAVITAVTAQTDRRVADVSILPPASISAQISTAFETGPFDAVKIGMLGNAQIVAAVAAGLKHAACPIVLDPVTHSSSGKELLDKAGQRGLLNDLLPIIGLITPNLPELEILTKHVPDIAPDRAARTRALLEYGAGAVLLKGGHDTGDQSTDTLYQPQCVTEFSAARHPVGKRGTGCTLSTAIACYLAAGKTLGRAVGEAKEFTHAWITSRA